MVNPIRNFRIPDHKWDEICEAAGMLGISAADYVRRCALPPSVVDFYVQNQRLGLSLDWQATVLTAVRKFLQERFEENLPAHLARIGLTPETFSPKKADEAVKRILAELRADPQCPCDDQMERAENDTVFLGLLYHAWQKAKSGEPGYAILNSTPGAPADKARWVVYIHGQKL
jgi:hypothetical protein